MFLKDELKYAKRINKAMYYCKTSMIKFKNKKYKSANRNLNKCISLLEEWTEYIPVDQDLHNYLDQEFISNLKDLKKYIEYRNLEKITLLGGPILFKLALIEASIESLLDDDWLYRLFNFIASFSVKSLDLQLNNGY